MLAVCIVQTAPHRHLFPRESFPVIDKQQNQGLLGGLAAGGTVGRAPRSVGQEGLDATAGIQLRPAQVPKGTCCAGVSRDEQARDAVELGDRGPAGSDSKA